MGGQKYLMDTSPLWAWRSPAICARVFMSDMDKPDSWKYFKQESKQSKSGSRHKNTDEVSEEENMQKRKLSIQKYIENT